MKTLFLLIQNPDYSMWAFPMSTILAVIFIVGILLLKRKQTSTTLTIILMLLMTAVTAVEGTFGWNLPHHPAFIVLMLAMLFAIGRVIYNSIKVKRSVSFILSHLGFFLIVFGTLFGAPDFRAAGMRVNKDLPSSYGYDPNGMTVPLPMKVQLEDFVIDYYEDGVSPKQYTSILDIDGKTLKTSVNHPCKYKGYLIYQTDYDHLNGEYSVIKMVRDPWLPLIFLGMTLLALGAILGLRLTWQGNKAVIPAVLVLSVIFAVISLARIRFGTLMPALRSLWFVPHLIIYMLAYSVMAISLICGIIALFGKENFGEISSRLLSTSSTLLILGMLCGAVWAKMAWGDFWTWDAKECWAAATWIITLIGTHLPSNRNRYVYLAVVLLAFIAMQITWYGVNYLPSAAFSMHTYNS